MLVSVQVMQPASVKTGRTADDAVDFIALREKEFGPDQRRSATILAKSAMQS